MPIPTANEIKAIMDEKGVTAYRLSKGTGIDKAALSRFFSGERGMSVESIDKLLDYLGYEMTIRKKRKPEKQVS
jgi:transcriptional regulator with XRE-family HTH domain